MIQRAPRARLFPSTARFRSSLMLQVNLKILSLTLNPSPKFPTLSFWPGGEMTTQILLGSTPRSIKRATTRRESKGAETWKSARS